MIKFCGDSLWKPLEMIFRSCIKTGFLPYEWKKAKPFERIIYNNIFEYLTTNKLISDNQSGFKPGDSCLNQLISVTHEICHSLDNGLEVRGMFLDISKAFEKVWHEGLILKLNQYGILENVLR